MSSTSSIERVQRRLQAILDYDITDLVRYTDSSPLVQFRAADSALRNLAEAKVILEQIKEGLELKAKEEWQKLSEGNKA